MPKIRDHSVNGIYFNSSLVLPYLKRAKNFKELLVWLYLRSISTDNFHEVLGDISVKAYALSSVPSAD
ncbi:MAG: hypothetical protein ACTS73_01515 [Arsenophonus sp. NEOnobi-MAG3]